jgi:methyl-accepting chemotaxis protein
MSISRRLWLILVVAVAMLVVLGLLMLRQIHGDLYQAKAEEPAMWCRPPRVCWPITRAWRPPARSAAKPPSSRPCKWCAAALRPDDYFWINDLQPKMIMHPANPKLDGQDLSAIRDPTALPCSTKWSSWPARAPARSTTAGPSPAPASRWPNLLYTAVRTVGLGHRLGRLHRRRAGRVRRQLRDASLVGLGIALLMALVVMLIARSIARPLQAVQAMGNIASGESDLTRRLDTHGRDEITHLGEHFNRFNGKLQGVVGQLQGAAHALAQSAGHVGDNAGAAQQHSAQQSLQMDQVATAINEVTYAVQDVAKTAEQAAGKCAPRSSR